jgi:High potential iron-sulfur protein
MSMQRRTFFLIPVAASAAGIASPALAQAPLVDEKSDQAKALGYVADAKKVDKAAWPKYSAGQLCSNCNFFQGRGTDKAAACTLFPAKQVAGPGWCNAWAKKA